MEIHGLNMKNKKMDENIITKNKLLKSPKNF